MAHEIPVDPDWIILIVAGMITWVVGVLLALESDWRTYEKNRRTYEAVIAIGWAMNWLPIIWLSHLQRIADR